MKNLYKTDSGVNPLLVGIFAALLATQASANFIDDYDVSKWSITDTASGFVDTSAAPVSVTLTGGDAEIGGDTDFTITATQNGNVTFDWSYINNDLFGYAVYDTFGYLLNGNFFELIDPNAEGPQAGNISFAISSGDIFGFRASTFDGFFGPSVTTVSNFDVTAAVPLPSTAGLLAIGLASLVARRRNPFSQKAGE